MKKQVVSTPSAHTWTRSVAVRALLAMGALVSMVLASGAAGHWL